MVITKWAIAIASLNLAAVGMPSVRMRIGMIKTTKHGMIMEINWRYIVRIVKLVLELWVCMMEVIAVSLRAVAALRSIESILLCIEVLWHIFMLINYWHAAEIVLSVISIRLLLRLMVFLRDILWVMSCLMDRFLVMDGLLFGDGEVCSNSGFKHWLFMGWLFTVHLRLLLFMSSFTADWLFFFLLLTPQVKLGLTLRHGHFFILRLLLFKFEVAVTSDFVMDWHSGDFLNVFVSGIVMDGGRLDVSDCLMDNRGCNNRLRMVISYRTIVAFIITRVKMLIDR